MLRYILYMLCKKQFFENKLLVQRMTKMRRRKTTYTAVK